MKKEVWKHLKMLLVIIYPYLYMIATIIIFIIGTIEGKTTESFEYTMLGIVLSVIIGVIITGICFLLALFNSIRSGTNSYGIYYPSRMNLIIKGCQIPAYLINFILGIIGFVMSIWGIGVLILVILVDFLTIWISGTNNIGTCINLKQNGILTKEEMIIFGILSYVYVLDVFCAIYLFYIVRKEKFKKYLDKLNCN